MNVVGRIISIIVFIIVCTACSDDNGSSETGRKFFQLDQLEVDGKAFSSRYSGVSVTPKILISFDDRITMEAAIDHIRLAGPSGFVELEYTMSDNDSIVALEPTVPLEYLRKYTLTISPDFKSRTGGALRDEIVSTIVTEYNPTDKFDPISDEALLSLVQEKTFKYFWEFAQPASGMARERNTSGNLVTSGGSGFGLMTIIVAIERGFITREEGLSRLAKIITFLETSERFHGAWSHWIDGNTGKVIPFSANDNGGDLVETSFLIQGLLTFRQYLNDASVTESELIQRINALWTTVEWNWYTKGGEKVLYWHWSPDKAWVMNHAIRGHNETLITYILAASSTTHGIDADVYHQGYARTGAIKNGKSFYNIPLPLGEDLGGPLFFTHYSFLGLDPRQLEDQYANYWMQNVNHSRINHAYAVDNPRNFAGYSDESWGLTASDNQSGYSAHSPSNDKGVITPTAALSSFPYTPDESMKALHFFYYKLGDKLLGEYGFKDAFNLSEPWIADSYLAIDQGPIVVMIENYRTGLLWDLFMSAPEIQAGLTKLDFDY